MKKNEDGTLVYASNNKFKLLQHDLSSPFKVDTFFVPYEIVTLYTDRGTEIEALKYVESNALYLELSSKKTGDLVYKDFVDYEFEEIPKNRHFSFNCHGQTFCDSQFWLDKPEMVELIVKDEYRYSEYNPEKNTGDALLLYAQDTLIHSVTINNKNEVCGKNGTLGTRRETSVSEFLHYTTYEFDKILVIEKLGKPAKRKDYTILTQN